MEMLKIMLQRLIKMLELSWTIEYYNIPKFYKILLKNKKVLYITLELDILFVITNRS